MWQDGGNSAEWGEIPWDEGRCYGMGGNTAGWEQMQQDGGQCRGMRVWTCRTGIRRCQQNHCQMQEDRRLSAPLAFQSVQDSSRGTGACFGLAFNW